MDLALGGQPGWKICTFPHWMRTRSVSLAALNHEASLASAANKTTMWNQVVYLNFPVCQAKPQPLADRQTAFTRELWSLILKNNSFANWFYTGLKFPCILHGRFYYFDWFPNWNPMGPQIGCCFVQGSLHAGFLVQLHLPSRRTIDDQPQGVVSLSNTGPDWNQIWLISTVP